MPQKNGIPGTSKESKKIREQIRYWKDKRTEKTNAASNTTSYWEILSSCSAL